MEIIQEVNNNKMYMNMNNNHYKYVSLDILNENRHLIENIGNVDKTKFYAMVREDYKRKQLPKNYKYLKDIALLERFYLFKIKKGTWLEKLGDYFFTELSLKDFFKKTRFTIKGLSKKQWEDLELNIDYSRRLIELMYLVEKPMEFTFYRNFDKGMIFKFKGDNEITLYFHHNDFFVNFENTPYYNITQLKQKRLQELLCEN